MKKRIVSLFLLLLITFSTTISLTACSNEEEVEDYNETITTEIDSSVPNITEMSKIEILAMSAEDVQKSVETYLPNYRTIYKIDENKEMSNQDWLNLASIICLQLYGSTTVESEVSADETTETSENDIYLNPTYNDIEPMSLSEFAAYMNTSIDVQYGAEYREKNEIDYTTMSDEELQELKNDLLETLAE